MVVLYLIHLLSTTKYNKLKNILSFSHICIYIIDLLYVYKNSAKIFTKYSPNSMRKYFFLFSYYENSVIILVYNNY